MCQARRRRRSSATASNVTPWAVTRPWSAAASLGRAPARASAVPLPGLLERRRATEMPIVADAPVRRVRFDIMPGALACLCVGRVAAGGASTMDARRAGSKRRWAPWPSTWTRSRCSVASTPPSRRPLHPSTSTRRGPKPRRGTYGPWADLLARTFGIDVLDCPRCHGRMKLVAMLTEPTRDPALLRPRSAAWRGRSRIMRASLTLRASRHAREAYRGNLITVREPGLPVGPFVQKMVVASITAA